MIPRKKHSEWIKKYCSDIKPNVIDDTYAKFIYHSISRRVNPDLFSYKSFSDLVADIEKADVNLMYSRKQQSKNYDIIIDNYDIFLVSPNTHIASKKLGLKYFSFRNIDGVVDCAWCSCYSNDSHFNYYYLSKNATIYYLLLKSSILSDELGFKAISFTVYDDGRIDASDELNQTIDLSSTDIILNKLGILEYIVPMYKNRHYNYYLYLKSKLGYSLSNDVYFTELNITSNKDEIIHIDSGLDVVFRIINNELVYSRKKVFGYLKRKLSIGLFDVNSLLYGYFMEKYDIKLDRIKCI